MSVHTVGFGGIPVPTDYLAQWAAWMRAAGRSNATIRTRLSGMQTLCHHAGRDNPAKIVAADVTSWLGDCEKPWTRSTYWMTVRCWVEWALDEHIICADPTAGLPRPRQPQCVPRPVSDAVIRALLASPPSRVRAYVALGALAGLRVHEIAKVRGEDLDIEAGWLFVDGKGGQRCALPLHPELAAIAASLPPVDYWFPGRDAGHVSGQWVGECIRRALRSVGSNATAHQLRHAFGTAVLRSSRDLRVTQELLRHASPTSTAIYTQVADVDKINAIRRLGWAA
jgi:integrase/recombinase XerD